MPFQRLLHALLVTSLLNAALASVRAEDAGQQNELEFSGNNAV